MDRAKDFFRRQIDHLHLNRLFIRLVFWMVKQSDRNTFLPRIYRRLGDWLVKCLMWTESLVIEEAFAHEHQAVPHTTAQEVIRREKLICVTTCLCRLLEKNCQNSLETCLLFKDQARAYILSGKGREINQAEALALLSSSQELNLVHNAVVAQGRLLGLCNCCRCCCVAVKGARYDFQSVRSSGFIAEIDEARCSHCGLCAATCVFEAVTDSRVELERCKGCGLCVVKCPEGAVRLISSSANPD